MPPSPAMLLLNLFIVVKITCAQASLPPLRRVGRREEPPAGQDRPALHAPATRTIYVTSSLCLKRMAVRRLLGGRVRSGVTQKVP